MKALIVIDAQNEFTAAGQRPVPNVETAMLTIKKHVAEARSAGNAIVWIRHFNRPDETPAFVPGSWGAEFIDGIGPLAGSELEVEMHKNVYGSFAGTDIGNWLDARNVSELLIMGFYTHGCVSTTSREAIMRDLVVYLDRDATGSCAIEHPQLGRITAEESRQAALLQLANMGAVIIVNQEFY